MGQGQVSADFGGPESTLLLGGKGTRNAHVFTFTKTGDINPIGQRFSHPRPKDCGGKGLLSARNLTTLQRAHLHIARLTILLFYLRPQTP